MESNSSSNYNDTLVMTNRYRDASDLTGEKPLREFAEVTIPVPWGHISGKWYGPQTVQPILGLHGWQDNAGTYDLLVPLFPPEVAFLSIDLPGHGLSSRLPDGCYYNTVDNLYIIRIIMKQYKWEKVSIIGHSMSAIIGFLFAAVFPDKVDMVIAIDALKPHQRPYSSVIRTMETRMDEFLREDERNRSNVEPPSYAYDELIERIFIGTFHSVNKNICHHMLARHIQKSEKYPNKYFFCRDRRLKFYNYAAGSQELCVEMAKRIECPYLFIKARHSSYFEEKKYYDEVFDILTKKPNFEYFECDGSHHLHMNNPELVIEPINNFIKRFGPKPKLEKSSKL
ncbi:probable serine hydrolase [Teleopsis dalmanni]|uniref:probable serine hydrolase n=1 Tax=Teleopsis dalmanni TaxID=139649 RepID=UPI0018CD475A|nr:probable serine hydrolase [Teleopsis dalmanni]XP_037936134.1 probable serine hydrolase [Teleopsis dalmanni]XP_037936215.1 probable serine hydrolase [Teleopsis dalmanni]XP_037939824.1 probable serine hydrolase [Teleopsis dalmanni]XP_037939825.1 probable serine hydrolase [Teleopsis dalmanni]XP_037939827.1 probable serine hydrolase [Teleopsis dalmanni]